MVEVRNKKAYYDYSVLEEIEAGIVLTGTEIKSVRKGSVDLKDSYVLIRNGEACILNLYIAPYFEGNQFNHEERRTRVLLLHKKEIRKLKEKVVQDGISLVPLKLYFKKNKVKILVGLCKGKKLYDKRESIKKRDLERERRNSF
ncbi:MAG: SsrA-binding protein SmpB [Bacilli bacterium]|nr:SsrA-binding protein SmpB [Bacilli bacterium]